MLMSCREALYFIASFVILTITLQPSADTLWLLLLGLDPASLAQSLRGSAWVPWLYS